MTNDFEYFGGWISESARIKRIFVLSCDVDEEQMVLAMNALE